MKAHILGALVLLLAAPTVQALSFTEDFEGFTLGGFVPETKPDQDWYDYTEGDDVGTISKDPPVIGGSQSFHIKSTGGAVSSQKATFTLAGPTQLSEFTFSIRGATINDNGAGSRQKIAIESTNPVRTMVEFYVFCIDGSNPGACELRVRFDQIDSTGQVLIATTAGDQTFNIKMLPNWENGTYNLFVDGVDDGWFPFLELPAEIARIQISQYNGNSPLDLAFDDWFIDGATSPAVAPDGDIANGLKAFATDIRFTSTSSLFLLGLVFFGIIALGVAIPVLVLGKDNTTLPALAFFLGILALWLVSMEWGG